MAERPPGSGGALPATTHTYVSTSRQRAGPSSATINGWRDGQRSIAATVAVGHVGDVHERNKVIALRRQPELSGAGAREPVVVEPRARAVEQPAAQDQPVAIRLHDRSFHRAHRCNGRTCNPFADRMKRAFVRPRIASARVRHRDALLQDARHAGLTTRTHEDGCALAPKLVVLREVAALRARRRKTGREIDCDIAAGKASSQRCLVEDVGRCQLGAARSGDCSCLRPAHQCADTIPGSDQVAARDGDRRLLLPRGRRYACSWFVRTVCIASNSVNCAFATYTCVTLTGQVIQHRQCYSS